jgi:molybdenum cofactor cytidylyltransferase
LSPRVAALVLAAGKSSRMGSNKLLMDFHGQLMIAHTVKTIVGLVDRCLVVTGFQADEIKLALGNERVEFAHNPDFELGLSTSLRVGVAHLRDRCDAILVCLADMPLLRPQDIEQITNAFQNHRIVVPTYRAQFGNPILWGAEFFTALMTCEGDRGARGLLDKFKSDIVEVAIDHEGVLLDADTPAALEKMRAAISLTRSTANL